MITIAVILGASGLAAGQTAAGGKPGMIGIVDSQSVLSIGDRDAGDNYALYRVYSALRLSDGRIAISNSSSQTIRLFDAKGVFIKNIGGRGAGPAEFSPEASMQMFRHGDSIIALDEFARRFHVFDAQFKFVQTRHLRTLEGFPFPFILGVLADGTLLAQAYVNGGASKGDPGAILKQEYALLRYSATGTFLNKIATVESRPRYSLRFANATSQPFIPLSAEPLQAVVDNEIFLVRGAKPEMEVFNSAGLLVRTIRWNATMAKASALFDQYRKYDLTTMSGALRAKYEHFYSLKLPLPEFAPTYTAIVVDTDKQLWLRRFTIGPVPATWDIVTRTGLWLGSVRVPPRLTLYEAGREQLLGRRVDDMDVESVQLLKLRRVKN